MTLSALAVAGLAAGAGYFGLQDCGWLDKFLVRSGCVGIIDIANLTSVFSSMEIDQEGRLVVAGVDYRALSGNARNVATYPQIVALDLESGKATDPLVNMDMIQNDQTGEVLLDFILSSKDAAGAYIVEWNGYRYARAENAGGETGGLLFAISHRAYGNAASEAFLKT